MLEHPRGSCSASEGLSAILDPAFERVDERDQESAFGSLNLTLSGTRNGFAVGRSVRYIRRVAQGQCVIV